MKTLISLSSSLPLKTVEDFFQLAMDWLDGEFMHLSMPMKRKKKVDDRKVRLKKFAKLLALLGKDFNSSVQSTTFYRAIGISKTQPIAVGDAYMITPIGAVESWSISIKGVQEYYNTVGKYEAIEFDKTYILLKAAIEERRRLMSYEFLCKLAKLYSDRSRSAKIFSERYDGYERQLEVMILAEPTIATVVEILPATKRNYRIRYKEKA